jgi:glutaredoxin 3
MKNDVVIYRTATCPYCVSAARLLTRKGVEFTEIDVTNDPERRSWLVSVTGQRTVPQIFIHDQPIGGYSELAELERRGALSSLIAGTSPAAADEDSH